MRRQQHAGVRAIAGTRPTASKDRRHAAKTPMMRLARELPRFAVTVPAYPQGRRSSTQVRSVCRRRSSVGIRTKLCSAQKMRPARIIAMFVLALAACGKTENRGKDFYDRSITDQEIADIVAYIGL